MSMINMSDLRLNSSNLRSLSDAIMKYAEEKATKKDDQVYRDFFDAMKNVHRLAVIAPKVIGKQINVATILKDAELILQLADVDFETIGEDLQIAKAFMLTAAKRMMTESKAEAGKFLLGIWVILQGDTVDSEVCGRVGKQLCIHLDYYLDRARNFDASDNTNNTTANKKLSWKESLH